MPAAAQTTTKADKPAATKTADDAAVTEVVVTGLRQSLRSAQTIKRNSDAILDAVVAEDIGKLPDNTAAETLARIAGIQVERFSDEANRVLIRGLPDVATTYNGREIFTAELRRVQLQDFPAQALAGIEVYKSGTADIVEPGLAGLINVRTRRPLDFKGRFIGGGVRLTYNDQEQEARPERQYPDLGPVGDRDRRDRRPGQRHLRPVAVPQRRAVQQPMDPPGQPRLQRLAGQRGQQLLLSQLRRPL
ncbi:TonB-dependent receptor plug domain-containing protein [Caulobacter segnis]